MDVFGGAPRFLAYPRALTVACGANAVLECRIAGDPRPAVAWERDAAPISPSARHRFLEEGDAYRLVVMKAGAEDSGQYICKAKNRVGETYAAATLMVADGGPGDQPAFLIRPSSARVSRGDDVVFTGRLSGCPQPLVTWEKDGKKLGEIFESAHFSAGTEGEGWHHLKIFGARPPDGGVYLCRAWSACGEATAAAVLLVEPGRGALGTDEPGPGRQRGERGHQKGRRGPQGPVSGGEGEPLGLAKVKAFSVWQGKHAKFRCLVTGKPTPEIVWRKGGCVVVPSRRHLLYQDREGYFNLKLLYCKQADGDLYTCAASNAAGHTLSSVLLHIKEPPTKFRSQLRDVEVREREQAVLECEVPAESMPAAWYLEDRRLQPSAKYIIEQQGSLRRLTIKDVTMDDDGVYLCQMKDGGRSVAEVAVKGKIVKRLPRKLDVLEGENAAFCVDLDEDNVEVRWYKDGELLSESHKTIIKSFGKTHILVFVNASAEDAGVVTFVISDSKSSSQLRVKPRRRTAPGAPENTRMNCERPNAASLTWDPPPDCGSTGAAGYVVERQEVGAEGWVQCLTTRTGSAVEILGDSVPAEGRYRFRVCSINEYGRGGQAEFPGAVHLVPAARILTHLNDATVCQDGEVEFTIELSAVVIGTWHMMGKQIQEDERFRVQQSRSQHSLLIRQVRLQENEAEITFVAHGVRDSAILLVKAAPVRISLSPGTESELCVTASESIVLSCEVSRANALVSWCKDGQEITPSDRMTHQSCGQIRRLVVHSSLPSDSGQYTCDAVDDVMMFCVTVLDPPVRIVNTADDSKAAYLKSDRIVLSCELSRPNAEVKWYKDGLEVEGSANVAMVSHGVHRSLIVQSAGTEDSGEYVCDAGDDSIFYDITVREPRATLRATEGGARTEYLCGETVVLSCEVSLSDAGVKWYKDGGELEEMPGVKMEAQGVHRRLVIPHCSKSDSGVYVCETTGDSLTFTIAVTEPPVSIVSRSPSELTVVTGAEFVLWCEVSRPGAEVRWRRDRAELEPSDRCRMEVEGERRRLRVRSATVEDGGTYVCDAADNAAEFKVTVCKPPVSIVSNSPSELTVVTGAEFVLWCEVSRPGAEVRWRRDGAGLEPSDRCRMEVEGECRRLRIRSATVEDGGTYMCDAADDAAEFKVTVSEPPVSIVSRSPLELTVVTGAEFVLWCEVSRPGAEVRWRQDGAGLEPSDRCRMEVEGECRKLRVRSATVEDGGSYVCDAADDAAEFKVTVSEPPVSIVSCSPSELTVVTGAEFVLWCEVSRPGAEVRWRRDGAGLEPSDRCRMEVEGECRRLRVRSTTVEDGGTYVCDAADDVAEFKVTISEPPVSIVSRSPSELTVVTGAEFVLWCEVSRPGAEVRWRRDGAGLESSDRCRMEVEGERRRLRVRSATVEDGGTYVCDAADDAAEFKVTVSDPPVRITRPKNKLLDHKCWAAEDILLECEVSRVDAQAKWHKDGEKVAEGGRVSTGSEGVVRYLRVLGAQAEDTGEYLCDVQSDSIVFQVTVEEPPVRIVGNDKVSEDRCFVESEAIAMTCELSRPDVGVRWYRDGAELRDSGRIRIDARGLTRELMIFDSEPRDSGQYVCDAGTDRLTFNVTVAEAPVLFTNKGKLPEEVTVNENGKAVLAAIVAKEKASVTWLRHREPVCEGEKYEARHESRVHSLIVKNVQKEDSGFYICRSADDEMIFNVNVMDLPLLFLLSLEDLCVQRDGTVTLWCELTRAKGDVVWLKDGREVEPSCRRAIRAEGRLRSLTLTKVTLEDQGKYVCESKDDRTAARVSVVVPRVVEFISDLHNVTVLEGDEATFKCMVSPEDARVVWKVNDSEVPPGSDQYVASRNGLCRALLIRDCRAGELTRVTAEAEGIVSSANLQVQEAQVLFTKMMASVVVEELQDATFEVEVCGEGAEVQWMKQGVVIQAGSRYLVQQEGRLRRLTVLGATFADRGNYRCETLHDRTQAKLSVEARRIRLRKSLVDMETVEGEAATFQVELSHPDVEGVWIKDGIRIKPCPSRRISVGGRFHSLTLSALTLEDTGTITFQSDSTRCSARLTVREPPVTFLKQLKDLQVPETTFVTLEAELSRPNVEVRWYKNDLEMKPNNGIRIYSMGRKRIAQLGRCGLEDSGIYTCDAGDDKTSAKLEVYEREIRIVKELEDVEVRENDNAIFVCEVSHEGVKGEWLKNGEKIKANNSVKMRQEGSKHFLLIYKVRAEDAGEIRFMAKSAESAANLDVNELPIKIVKPLRDKTALEKHKVILECKVSKPRARVRWYRAGEELRPTDKYEICSEDCYRKLVVHDVSFEDEDTYTCDAFDDSSSAKVLVEEQAILMVKSLEDVQVTAPGGALLECEVSVPVIRAPQWSLNGQVLQNGKGVRLENNGTVQRLILSETSPEMTGLVKFTAGKARSSAHLTVKAN